MKPKLSDHWKISTFRLAITFGVLFAISNIALLGLIYWQTSRYLEHRIDSSIVTMSKNFKTLSPAQIIEEIDDALIYDLRRSSIYGLFSQDGKMVTGNMPYFPGDITIDGEIHPFFYQRPTSRKRPSTTPLSLRTARLIARRLPDGEVLFVGRDFTELAEIKDIILNALLFSGAIILALGLAGGFILSIRPLRRISVIRGISENIIQGKINFRLPVSERHDELDMLSVIVNTMLDETERLLIEIKSVTDSIAHDLRTPLTRLHLLLSTAQQEHDLDDKQYDMLGKALNETNGLLKRFRALLRISDIENKQRKSGFSMIAPSMMLEQIRELFEPLAEDKSIQLSIFCEPTDEIFADSDLLFECLSNLVDNAIKFTPPDGKVLIKLNQQDSIPHFEVIDTGCGIAPDERDAVLGRFYRSSKHRETEGHGLGLSIVIAILHLHGYTLSFQDTDVGTHITVYCTTSDITI